MSAPPNAAPRRLLIVDDEQGIRDLVGVVARKMVGPDGVLTAGDVPTATRILSEERVGAILTDLRMPGPSGIELVLAAHRTHPTIPIAIMTGYHEDVIDGVSLSSLPVQAVLRKPFTATQLRAVLTGLLPQAD